MTTEKVFLKFSRSFAVHFLSNLDKFPIYQEMWILYPNLLTIFVGLHRGDGVKLLHDFIIKKEKTTKSPPVGR